MSKLTLHIATHHPAGVGHFPGNPIIPGALLLAEVLCCIEKAEAAHFNSCNLKAAKFFHPVRPGDQVEIEYTCSEEGVITLHCEVAGIPVLSGGISAAT